MFHVLLLFVPYLFAYVLSILLDVAKKCGAEIIKNQTHLPYYEMSEEAKKIKPPNANKSIYDVIKESSLNKKEELKLFKYFD